MQTEKNMLMEPQNNSSSESEQEIVSTKVTSTVSLEEINYFSNLSQEWVDINGPMRGLHIMGPIRIKLIRDSIASTGFKGTNENRPLEGLKVLDVGCGGGILSEALAKLGAQVTGLDASEELIKTAELHATLDKSLDTNLSYVVSTIEDFAPENEEKYDLVVASEIIEHVNNQEVFLKNCVKVLKANGTIFITTINRTFFSWIYAILIMEYVLKYIPKGTHKWNKFISPDEVGMILNKYNCDIKFVRGLISNPITEFWSESSFTSGWYGLHATKSEFAIKKDS